VPRRKKRRDSKLKKTSWKKRVKKKSRSLEKFFLFGFAVLFLLLVYFLYDLPDIDNVKPIDTRPSISILSNDGAEIAKYGGNRGKIIGIRDIPQHLIEAVLSVEDRRFYSHFGIDPIGLARAMWTNIKARRWVQGGSTITQQLTKNLFLTTNKTIKRKVQEALMALQIEHRYNKNEILSAYLNRVYFGAGAYGVDSAARTYFKKPASRLTLWESAILAGLLKAPSHYSPATNPKLAKKRAREVIRTMEAAGYIDVKTEKREIRYGKIPIVHRRIKDLNNYFADWVINQIDSFITTSDGDIIVKTTLDSNLQSLAEKKYRALFKRVGKRNNISQMALVTESYNGAIVSMIGGVNYKLSQFNRVTQAKRQTGSAFKPFIYLAAIESGFKPENIIEDAPITKGDYRPKNYGNKYNGMVDLTTALKKSLNSVALRLLKRVGIKKLHNVVKRLAITSKIGSDLSIALGTSDISLMEMTNAYTIIANGGRSVWPYGIISITNGNGEELYQRRRFKPPVAFQQRDIRLLDKMMTEVVSNEGTGRAAQLSGNYHTAGKTGTTQDYRDAWFIGYTNKFVTGIWMGNDNNSPMKRVTGGKYPARLWHNYMSEAVKLDIPKSISGPLYDKKEMINNIGRWASDFPLDDIESN